MSECCGLFGKLFGHKFESHQIKSKYIPSGISATVTGIDDVERYLELQRDIYEIRCRRCGRKSDE